MENSILISTKKILGLDASYTAFDLDIVTFINTTFSTLKQLGVGPEAGFSIDDSGDEVWTDFVAPNEINDVRTYVFLKVQSYFDPPTTSYLISARKEQIAELEWRMNVSREGTLHPFPSEVS